MKIFKKFITKEVLIISVIFLFALIIRIYNLGILPGSLHQDEIMNGYVGRFILLNGKDLYGNSWPLLYFDRFGDFPNVLPMYLSGLSTFFFGINEFAIRFPIAFFGALGILPVYLIAKLIFPLNSNAKFFPSIIFSLLPWHIILSRSTAEGITGLTVFSFSLWFVLVGILNKQIRKIFLSSIFFLLTYFLYPSFRVLVPVSLLGLLFIPTNFQLKKILIVLTVFFFALTLFVSTTKWGQGRYLQTSLLQNIEIQNLIKGSNEAFSFDDGQNNIIVARIFHNKFAGLGREFLNQYFAYFSPNYLFLNGGLPPRYIVPGQGLIYITSVLIILLAALSIETNQTSNISKYMYYLLAIAPIPAALTIDDTPNVHRSVLMILPLVFIISFALNKIYKMKLFTVPIIYIVLLVFVIEFTYFFHQYNSHSSSYKSVLRNDGNKQTIQLLVSNQNKYKNIYIPVNNTMSLYYLFYTNNFSSNLEKKFSGDFVIDKVDNVIFLQNWCPSQSLEYVQIPPESLVINYGDCPPDSRFKEINSVYRKDSTKAYSFLIKND